MTSARWGPSQRWMLLRQRASFAPQALSPPHHLLDPSGQLLGTDRLHQVEPQEAVEVHQEFALDGSRQAGAAALPGAGQGAGQAEVIVSGGPEPPSQALPLG